MQSRATSRYNQIRRSYSILDLDHTVSSITARFLKSSMEAFITIRTSYTLINGAYLHPTLYCHEVVVFQVGGIFYENSAFFTLGRIGFENPILETRPPLETRVVLLQ